MSGITKIAALGGLALLLLGGSAAGACKFALDCNIRSGQGDAPPIEKGRATLPAGWSDRTVVSGLELGDKILVAHARYVPQQGPQASPLTMGAPKGGSSGQAPRSKKGGGGGG